MKMGKSIRGALSYNEQKVSQGTAQLLLASRFSRDVSEMGFSEKLVRFEKLNGLNPKSKTNTLHLSLNFSPDDKLDTEKMQRIAVDYMERIGFGRQPFLVYQHNDTAHPHLHIVTTTIQPTGRSIYLHNIGRRKSEPARKAIELEYGLVQAQSRKPVNSLSLEPVSLSAADYGKSETKRVISNIVREITSRYKYTSLGELNAVLRRYNVVADPGPPGSRMRQKQGLVYCLLDRNGKKIGVPIKASSIYSRPTLSYLERRFEQNRIKKISSKAFVVRAVEGALAHPGEKGQFLQSLRHYNIAYHVSYNEENNSNSIYFIDHKKKVVFSNSELGISEQKILNAIREPGFFNKNLKELSQAFNDGLFPESLSNSSPVELIKNLLATETNYNDVSPEFFKKKKRRKRKV